MLCCRECNVKKRYDETEIAHWDEETLPDFCPELASAFNNESKIIDVLNDFIKPTDFVYCISITYRDEDILERKEYDKLRTIKFYHKAEKDCFEQIEDWLLDEDKIRQI